MILVDANLLLYAKFSDYPIHAAAREWLESVLNGTARVGLPWESLTAFVRISTNPRLVSTPLGVSDAWSQVEEWLQLAVVWVPGPTENHAKLLGDLLRKTASAGNLVPDAHLAAIALGHGLLLCSTDRDFSRFDGLRLQNPLHT